ncbi:MAG: deoxyribose-phosphate aldolase [Lachnospiraceae bacterium]|nr:deoxyribose-phosphate aldolase [Lachnospiraceae bacterium]
MRKEDVLQKVDHTLLAQTATWQEIKQICEDAMTYQTASVCIPPSFVKQAKEYVGDRMAVCTVIGFPNGYNTTEVKKAETEDAIQKGADEIDMVINLGWVKEQRFDLIEEEIRVLKEACGEKILKVIIETCLLSEEEKIKMCEVVTKAGADFIKTSTGFSTGGATLEDIELFAKHVGSGVKIKAAGGIASFEDGEAFIKAGASRLGTSRLIKLMKEEK